MSDNTPTPLQRYIKGMHSIHRSHMDSMQASGWDAVNKEKSSGSDGGGELVEMLISFSAGKTWPKWNALFFAVCTLVYCYINSYSILATILFTGIAAFCGYAIIGLAIVALILGFVGVGAFCFVQLISWLWS
ncbi:MAG: hypothetical protein ACRBCK_07795 [Alphaproteobacteria bacterium]